MYRSIVVPLDLGADADRALPTGAALARRIGAELDTVTVTSPPHIDHAEDEAEIRAHARAAGVHVDRVLLRHDYDVTTGILAETATNDGLLCCATHARGRVADLFMHSMSAQLVRQHRPADARRAPGTHGPTTPVRRHPALCRRHALLRNRRCKCATPECERSSGPASQR